MGISGEEHPDLNFYQKRSMITMSKNTTKRSLLASVFALVLCVAMLVGSTFAWFTDTATTGVNKIQSGKLDVKLTYLTDNNEWKEVTKDTKLFKDGAL